MNKVDRIKSDERILGDSEFVMQVLAEADETFDRRYKLKSQGYDIARIEQKGVDLFGIKKDELYSRILEFSLTFFSHNNIDPTHQIVILPLEAAHTSINS